MPRPKQGQSRPKSAETSSGARRRVRPVRPTVIPSRGVVASAHRYTGKAPRLYHAQSDWQKRAYEHFATMGEARYAARYFGHALSRAVLSVGIFGDDGFVPSTGGEAVEEFKALFGGANGQAQMLDSIGVHLTIAGECYLVGREITEVEGMGEGEVWEIISTQELRVTGSKWMIDYGEGYKNIELSEDDTVIRIWVPDPAKRMEPDSPFRSLLSILDEIDWLTRYIFAQATSRLAGAGILILPEGMTMPKPPAQDGEETEVANQADAMMLLLGENMLAPITDPSLPSAKVPIVITAPPDAMGEWQHLKFWTELDENAKDLREEAIRRFAIGMDLEPEVLLGMSSNGGTGGGNSNGVSHWGAWQIEESTIKMHIEPMLETVVNALTVGYLRPLVENTEEQVYYDTKNLRLRPDRSKEAQELRDVLKPEVVARENGFDASDLMTDEERGRFLLWKMASGSATPEMVLAALRELGVNLNPVVEQHYPQHRTPPETPPELPPPPSLEDHPTRPRTPAENALLPACESMVFRAMERCGNRLRNRGNQPPGVPAHETHCYVQANGTSDSLLEDAFPHAKAVLADFDNADKVIETMHAYCKSLLTSQQPHTRERLAQWLELAENTHGQ